MVRKKESNSPASTPEHKFQTYGLVIAALALAVAAIPVYWSYLCRTSGNFCEGSVASPTLHSPASERVAAKLATESGQKNFIGLIVRRAGVPPYSQRYDIVAQFSDETETAIDSLTMEGVVEIFAEQRKVMVAIVGHGPNGKGARITAYFPAKGIVKRVFDISASSSDIELKNIAYDAKNKTLYFDITTDFPWVTINNNNNTTFSIGDRSYSGALIGATVNVELSETMHVAQAYDAANRARNIDSHKALSDCQSEALAKTEKVEGEVFPCLLDQDDRLASRGGRLYFFEHRQGKLHEVGSEPCTLCYWVKDKGLKAAFVTRDQSRHSINQSKKVDIWISIWRRPFDTEHTLFVKGECTDFSPWDLYFTGENTIRFRLDTDCSEVYVNNRRMSFRTADQNGTKISEVFELTLDAAGLPIELAQK